MLTLLKYIKKYLIIFQFLLILILSSNDVTYANHRIPLIWNTPFNNENFIGRTKYLKQIHLKLSKQNNKVIGITGMAGVGKTQIAKKYAHLYKSNYDIVWWINADQNIANQYRELAERLNSTSFLNDELINLDIKDNEVIVTQVKERLRKIDCDWLIIFDNIFNKNDLVKYIPEKHNLQKKGHVLMTSKNSLIWDDTYKITKFTRFESTKLLEKLTGTQSNQEMEELCKLLDDYPLAVAQAGSYMKVNPTIDIGQYLEMYKNKRHELWKYEKKLISNQKEIDNYKHTVETTLLLSLEELKKQSAIAYDLLTFCTFFKNTAIPEIIMNEYFNKGGSIALNEAISLLTTYSLLINTSSNNKTNRVYTMHDIQQLVIKDNMSESIKNSFIQKATKSLAKVIPTPIDKMLEMFTSEFYLMENINVLSEESEAKQIFDENLITLYIRKLEFYLAGKRDEHTSALLIEHIEKLLPKAESLSDIIKARFSMMKAQYISWYRADYNLAIKELDKVLEYLKDMPEAYEEYLMAYNRIAQTYMLQGDANNARQSSDMGLKIIQQARGYLGNKDAFYSTRARIFEDQGILEEAYNNVELSMKEAEEIDNKVNNQSHLIVPASVPVIVTKALILTKMQKYSEGYKLTIKVEKLLKKIYGNQNTANLASLWAVKAACLYGKQKIEEAHNSIKQSQKIFSNLSGDKKIVNRYHGYLHIVLGRVMIAKGDYDKAQQAFLEALEIYTKLFSKLKIDDISTLYTELAINSLRINEQLTANYYYELHKKTFGIEHSRTFQIIKFFNEKGVATF